MSLAVHPIVVGIFKEEAQAKSAVEVLRNARFSDDQIGIALPSGELKTHRNFYELLNMELHEKEANYYKREFEAGQSLVWIRHDGRHWEAVNILYGSRIHKYLNRLGHQSEPSQAPSTSNPSTNTRPQRIEEETTSTRPDWQKLLIDANLDQLLDQFT